MAEYTTLPYVIRYYGPNNSNIDYWYGPYNSLDDALTQTETIHIYDETYIIRYVGMTVGILNSQGHISEYWFRDGIEDNDLIPKIPDIEIPEFPTLDDLLGNLKIAKFNRNGGEGHQNSELTDEESIIRLPQCMFTKSGDEFQGWCEVSDPNEVDEEHPIVQPGSYYPLETSTTFYAMWNQITTYTVSWTSIGHCQITCTANGTPIQNGDAVAAGSTIVFTATPDSGYRFLQWTGLPSGQSVTDGTTATIQSLSGNVPNVSCAIRQVHTVSWTNGTGYMITAKAGPNASDLADIISGASVDHGSTVQFICTLSDGYTFGSWNGLSDIDPQSNREVTISQLSSDLNVSCNVRRNFGIKFGDLSHGHYIVNIDNGIDETVTTDSKDVVEGAEVEISYAGQSGYTAGTWSVAYGDDTSGTPNYSESQGIISFTMPSHPLEISVTEVNGNTYTVSATVYPANSGSVSGTGNYAYNAAATLTASPNEGYEFTSWTENGQVVGTLTTYTIDHVTENVTLVANFTAIPTYTITVQANPTVGGEVSGGGSKPSGSSATVTAAAASGYHFVKWTENNADVDIANPYTFTVTGNRTLVAQFEENAPDEVNVIELSGAAPDKTTLDNLISYNVITINSAQRTPGVLNTVTINRQNVGDSGGYTILIPSNVNYQIQQSSLGFIDGFGNPYPANAFTLTHGLPVTEGSSTLVRTITYNDMNYEIWSAYTSENDQPMGVKFIITE